MAVGASSDRQLNTSGTDELFSDTLRKPITGVVRDADGKPLEGVNVVVKGTKNGVVTNAKGEFSIEAKTGDKLVISSIGYGSEEITINSSLYDISVSLEMSTSPLDEVQIIAYGKTSRRLSTGNISTVKAEDIAKLPVGNPVLAF